MRRRAIATVVAAVLAVVAPAGESSARDDHLMGLDAVQSARIAEELGEDLRDCRPLDAVFVPDCLRAAARSAARRLSSNAAYWEVEVALTRINRRLDHWVRAAADADADRLSHHGTRLRAVRPAALPEADVYMRALIDDAVADMLGGPPDERPYYEPVARVLAGFAAD